MSVELLPASVLNFPRPLTQTVKRTLTIHNPHSSPVAFKVKTTAPKQYCVRPNAGRVEPGDYVEVQVLLQPLEQEPPAHAKCKDKFLVQSALIPPDKEMTSLSEMWSQTEKANKLAIHEQKIKCAYVAADDGYNGSQAIPEEEEHPTSADQSKMLDESQIYSAAESDSSPLHSSKDVSKSTTTAPVPASAKPPTVDSKAPAVEPPLPPLTANTISETKGPSPTDAALEKSLATTTSDSDKLKAALAEIEKLRAELSEAQGPQVTGLRKRGGATSSGASVDTAVEKVKEVVATSQGVPIEVVGALLLAVFILTYLFF